MKKAKDKDTRPFTCTKCGHTAAKPEPHKCSEGFDDDPLLFARGSAAEVSAPAVIDGRAEVLAYQERREREFAEDISRAYADATRHLSSSVRKVIVCGLLLAEQKGRVKHGEFGPWLEKHCPEISWKTVCAWMNTAESAVCLALGIEEFTQVKFDSKPLHQVLQLPANVLSPEAQKIQEKLFDFVDGKSQRQLQLAWKDTEATKGGFRPDEKAVQKWLKKNHKDLAGTKYADLPAAIQKEFRADYERSQLSPKERAELEEREAEEAIAQIIGDIDLFVITGETLNRVKDATRKALLAKGEEMNRLLREINKGAK